MRIALIPPTEHIITYAPFGQIDLVLPHLWIRDTEYRAMYRSLWEADPNRYIILDNGAAESQAIFPNDLIGVIHAVKPHEFALPDALGDPVTTLQNAKAWGSLMHELPAGTKVGYVAQGRTLRDALEGVMTWRSFYGALAQVVYIPRILMDFTHGTARIELASLIHSMMPELEIHLFGMNKAWPSEILAAGKSPYIRSVDSSLPFYYGMNLQGMWSQQRIDRPEHYFESVLDSEQMAQCDENVAQLLVWADGQP